MTTRILQKSEINTQEELLEYRSNPLYNPRISHRLEHMPLSALIRAGYVHEGDDVLRYIRKIDELLKMKSAYSRADWRLLQKNLAKIRKKRYCLQDIFDINHDSTSRVKKHFNITRWFDETSENPVYYLDENMLTSFMIYECVPKGTRRVGPKGRRHFIYYTPEARLELLDIMLTAGYDPTRLPSLNDRTISVGAFQFRRSTFFSLKKLYPELFGDADYGDLIKTLDGQSLMAAVLLYDNALYFNRNIYAKSSSLRKLFTKASLHDKRRFLVSVIAAMYNSGPTDIRNVMNNSTLRRSYKNLEELRRAFIKDLYRAGGEISAPYAEYVGELYSYVERKNNYYRSAYSSQTKITPVSIASIEPELQPVYAKAESDVLFIDTSRVPVVEGHVQETAQKIKGQVQGTAMDMSKPKVKQVKHKKIRYRLILGKPGNLLLRETKNMKYYTFTLPLDWEESDISVLLTKDSYIKDIREYNEQEVIKQGDYFFLPVEYMTENLRDGGFATIHVDGKIDKSRLEEIADEYCVGDRKRNAMLIRIYSNIIDITDVDQSWVRIPIGILKNKYRKKYTP